MEGIADKVRIDSEGEYVALRFVVQPGEGHPVAVELRGEEVHGVLDNGDTVKLSGVAKEHAAGLQRPCLVENKTTGSVITVSGKGRIRRGVHQVRTLSVSALISAIVTGLFKPVLEGARSIFQRRERSSRPRLPKAAKVLVVVTLAGVPAAVGAVELGRTVFKGTTQHFVSVRWTPVDDATGYSVSWTHSPTATPDATPELPGTASETRSRRLPQGRWYFHLRTIGGGAAGTRHRGPFVIRGG